MEFRLPSRNFRKVAPTSVRGLTVNAKEIIVRNIIIFLQILLNNLLAETDSIYVIINDPGVDSMVFLSVLIYAIVKCQHM